MSTRTRAVGKHLSNHTHTHLFRIHCHYAISIGERKKNEESETSHFRLIQGFSSKLEVSKYRLLLRWAQPQSHADLLTTWWATSTAFRPLKSNKSGHLQKRKVTWKQRKLLRHDYISQAKSKLTAYWKRNAPSLWLGCAFMTFIPRVLLYTLFFFAKKPNKNYNFIDEWSQRYATLAPTHKCSHQWHVNIRVVLFSFNMQSTRLPEEERKTPATATTATTPKPKEKTKTKKHKITTSNQI